MGGAADLGFTPAVLTPGYHMPPWRAPILLFAQSELRWTIPAILPRCSVLQEALWASIGRGSPGPRKTGGGHQRVGPTASAAGMAINPREPWQRAGTRPRSDRLAGNRATPTRAVPVDGTPQSSYS